MLCAVDGLDVGGADELDVLLGVVGCDVLGVVETVVLAVVLGALVVVEVEAGVVGAGAELVVGVGTLADVCDVLVRLTERVSGVWLVLVPTDAAGGEPGLWLPLCSTRTSAVASAAMTATDSTPATSPAPPLPRAPRGGSPTPTRSGVRSPTGSITDVARSADVSRSVGSGAGPGVSSGSASGSAKTAIPS